MKSKTDSVELRSIQAFKVRPLAAALLGSFLALALGACQTTGISDEAELTTTLAPMEKPIVQAGDTTYWLRDGSEEITNRVVSINGDMMTGKNSEGCQYTEIAWGFAPSSAT